MRQACGVWGRQRCEVARWRCMCTAVTSPTQQAHTPHTTTVPPLPSTAPVPPHLAGLDERGAEAREQVPQLRRPQLHAGAVVRLPCHLVRPERRQEGAQLEADLHAAPHEPQGGRGAADGFLAHQLGRVLLPDVAEPHLHLQSSSTSAGRAGGNGAGYERQRGGVCVVEGGEWWGLDGGARRQAGRGTTAAAAGRSRGGRLACSCR